MNRDRTNNQNLWSNCYWGTGSNACEEVIQNRNEFAIKWEGIKYYKTHQRFMKNHHNNGGEWGYDKTVGSKPTVSFNSEGKIVWDDYIQGIHFNNQYLDHSEYYILPDKRKMILYHPYHIEQEALDYVTKNGFVMIPELYAKGAYSFLKVV
tara:strand:- start:1086 stop:1538 length:453 start_codon:yes stop_codon:yes gene_type:complete